MNSAEIPLDPPVGHRHVFLGAGHARQHADDDRFAFGTETGDRL